jgi:guanylate kinase|tara:strand:+ start:165 stop:545 length:381 start_codon:yes stop_codon:yes gene_type:complete
MIDVKMTLAQVMRMYEELKTIQDQALPVRVAFTLGDNMGRLRPAVDNFEECKIQITKRLNDFRAKKNSTDAQVEKKLQEANEELAAEMLKEYDFQLRNVDLDDFPAHLELRPSFFKNCGSLVQKIE